MKRFTAGCPGCGSPDPWNVHSARCTEPEDRITFHEDPEGEWIQYSDIEHYAEDVDDTIVQAHDLGRSEGLFTGFWLGAGTMGFLVITYFVSTWIRSL